jgi:nucleotide-binding universal stress UspA family protein
MYNKILVPTDGSTGMKSVVDHAAGLAALHDATLYGLYVVNTASLNDLPMDTSWEGLSQALEEEGQEGLAAFEDWAGDVPVETTIREGSPSTEIVEYAAEQSCDVVVMGTHGRSGVNRLLLGSVAERVVRTSQTPVLTIRVDDSGVP